jgi:hypothetical protein
LRGDEAEVCTACERWRQQDVHVCYKCHRIFDWHGVHFTGEHHERVISKACAPDLTTFSCDICHKQDKLALDFPEAERAEKMKGLRRCWQCFTCVVCGVKHSWKSGLAQAERCCVKCRVSTCDVCGEMKHHGKLASCGRNKTRDSHIRCESCAVCPGCTRELTADKFHGDSKLCRKCIADDVRWKCRTCNGEFEATKFDADNLRHHQESSRQDSLVCLECRETKGATPKDARLYHCPVCGDRGHLKFDAETLAKYRKASEGEKQSLPCKDCLKTHERFVIISFCYQPFPRMPQNHHANSSLSQSTCLSVRPHLCLRVCLFFCLCVCVSVFLSVCLYVRPSVCPSARKLLSMREVSLICLFVVSVCVCLSIVLVSHTCSVQCLQEIEENWRRILDHQSN